MSFSESLRKAREQKGLTQQQVADVMQIDKSTYCGYETGKRSPDVPKIKQLSQILGASADDLIETGHKKTLAPISEDERIGPAKQALLDALSDMDVNSMQTVLDVVKSVKRLREK